MSSGEGEYSHVVHNHEFQDLNQHQAMAVEEEDQREPRLHVVAQSLDHLFIGTPPKDQQPSP